MNSDAQWMRIEAIAQSDVFAGSGLWRRAQGVPLFAYPLLVAAVSVCAGRLVGSCCADELMGGEATSASTTP